MGELFQPSIKRAAELRLSMALSLHASLANQLHQSLASAPYESLQTGSHVLPSDFTAYFDLVAPPEACPDSSVTERAQQALIRLNEAPSVCRERPRVATLAPPHFAPNELSALVRWWDTEPQNALCLEAVEVGALQEGETLIARALDALQAASPELYGELTTIVREVVLARPSASRRMSFGGVSSFAAWGAVAINQSAHTHWTQFFKTLVHECAHLVLFAIAREQPLVLNDPRHLQPSPLRLEPRPLDGIFHAAFVSAREAVALDACLEMHEKLSVEDMQRLNQMLEDSVLAFWDCCAQLDEHAQLAPLGEAILQEAKSYMHQTFEVQSVS